jgi:hypothetical protein
MILSELKTNLTRHFDKSIRFVLPTGSKVPPHAHVTEVARIEKHFVDCGGTFRKDSWCRLQVWFQDDTDHRLTAGKLLTILEKSASFIELEDLEVDVEYEAPYVSQFPLLKIEPETETLVIHLGTKHTACLAEDRCIPPAKSLLFKKLPTLETPKCC